MIQYTLLNKVERLAVGHQRQIDRCIRNEQFICSSRNYNKLHWMRNPQIVLGPSHYFRRHLVRIQLVVVYIRWWSANLKNIFLQFCKENKIHVTVHAGENGNAEEVKQVKDLFVVTWLNIACIA